MRKDLPRIFSLVFFLLFPGFLHGIPDLYWEAPEVFSPRPGNFPVSASNGRLSVVAWQESEGDVLPGGTENGRMRIALAVKTAGGTWQTGRRAGGIYDYSGADSSRLSIALDQRGRILIAAAVSPVQTEILISDDGGEHFEASRIDNGFENPLAPQLFNRSGGGWFLFITRRYEQSLSLYYSRSEDGVSWSSFEPFAEDPKLRFSLLPSHAVLDGTDYVIFQSLMEGGQGKSAFQLFIKTSADGGRTWSALRRFTDFRDTVMNTAASPDRFDNQRPRLLALENSLFLVWERRFGSGSPQIYGAVIGTGGPIGAVQRVNRESAFCNNPVPFLYEGEPGVVWFDNRRGDNRVYMARREGEEWRNYDLSGLSGNAAFARPVVDPDGLSVFWQTLVRNTGRIYALLPDTSVDAPRIIAGNFIPGRRNRGDRARISWNIPPDPSGIRGFSYLWSRDPDAEPPRQIMSYAGSARFREEIAREDGTWYFSLMAQDLAGNWSGVSRTSYLRDTTPPPPVLIRPPQTDERGYLSSNTFSLSWNPSPAPDAAGYTWNLQYLGSPDLFSSLSAREFAAAAAERFKNIPRPFPLILGTEPSVSFVNEDDGIWSFTVSAIDEVGNVGIPSRIFLRTNKYVPRTGISYVDVLQDAEGTLDITILGRGFNGGGGISRIFLDEDGKPPYDREFFLNSGDYRVLSDREITGLRIENIREGHYRLGVEHPRRGVYLSDIPVRVDEAGTVKFGDYSGPWKPSWRIREERRYVVDTVCLIMLGIFIFCGAGFVVTLQGIGNVIAESAVIRLDAAALVTGDFMPSEKKKRLTRIKRRGMGLRLKLASFTIVLILLVVLMVSAPLYVIMTRTQQETLLRGLWDRASVLLEGLASGVRAYLPAENILELSLIPAQSSAVPEARYVTITGFGSGGTVFNDHVWATNDPDILDKIDTAEFQPGLSRLEDILSPRLEGIARELNSRAREAVGDLSVSIAGLNQEALALAPKSDWASKTRFDDILSTTRSLEGRLTEKLTAIAREIGSEPIFSPDNPSSDICRTYIFFKPILFRQGTEDTYFRGLIRLEISLDSILGQIEEGQRRLLQVILIVALAAITIGTIGTLIFSTLIIQPIRKLVSHVEQIRDTEDKTQLDGVDIQIKSQDEIAVLGNTINDMTHGLVKAAMASQDLSIGKEVQKKFIPLELDRDGNKLTTGYKDTPNAHFFGYYEGAKGVSGDYFDYQDLDGRYFAIIKCDVAGKGIPAALIMIQVATMFLNYFKTWKPTEKGMRIEEVVYQINDFIETLGFKGRFAAFALCLFDSQTGILRFCNAGDNIVHIFDAAEGRVKTITLPETPAAGVLPNVLVESKGGYRVQTRTLNHGDILLLYTDGIEETKRKFRNGEFKEIICNEGPPNTPHANHVSGQGNEEMGAGRVEAIINAVMNRKVYSLYKYHNPEGDTELQFDFTSCKGKVEEVIMALISVEKMFRCYKDPGAKDDARVLVDKKIDAFLKEHFIQYRSYCSDIREYPGNDTYMYYTHVREDDQYDDLTILGIKRK